MVATTTPANAVIANSELTDPAKETGASLVEHVHDAVESGVQGATEGEDAANAEPVPEAESGIHTDPPDGVDVQAMAESCTDQDAAAVTSDLGEYAVDTGLDAGLDAGLDGGLDGGMDGAMADPGADGSAGGMF